MTMINAGKYQYQLTLRQAPLDASRDAFGGRVGVGETLAVVWAEKQDWSGSEVDEAGRRTASQTTKFKIRFRTDVVPQMQAVLDSDVYEILSVLDFDGTRRELVLETRKVIE